MATPATSDAVPARASHDRLSTYSDSTIGSGRPPASDLEKSREHSPASPGQTPTTAQAALEATHNTDTVNTATATDLEKAQTFDPSFEVSWDGPSDPANPRSMSTARKWLIVLIVSSTSSCVACTSSLYTSTYAQIEAEFGCSRIVATLGLSLFVLGLGIGPMLLGPLSEFYGRRKIYICSLTMFLIWFAPCAAAQNIQTELVGRFFSGLCGAAFLSVAGGTVGDMFDRNSLQAPMMVYTASPFIVSVSTSPDACRICWTSVDVC